MRIVETLELLDFTEPMNRRLGGFSKGMCQRAGIAQAILHRPTILFHDEATTGLDPEEVLLDKCFSSLISALNS